MDLDAILHDRGSPVARPITQEPQTQKKTGSGKRFRPENLQRGLRLSRDPSNESSQSISSTSSVRGGGKIGGPSLVGTGSWASGNFSQQNVYPSALGVSPSSVGARLAVTERTRLIGSRSMPSLPQSGISYSKPLNIDRARDVYPSINARPKTNNSSTNNKNSDYKGGYKVKDDNSNNARGGGGGGGGGGEGKALAAVERPFGFSRRKAPIAPAVRYLLEVVCTDLVACGESFVPDERGGQTLVPYGSFVAIEVDEALDTETTQFMEGRHDEAYGRGVGLPGLSWTSGKARVDEISTLSSDASFDSGGSRLSEAARLFHTALTIPLYSADGIVLWGVGFRQLIGVLVVYFPGPENHATALIAYASAVAASTSAVSELMVHRALFVEGRANRVKRNLRVMAIALMFAAPMFIRYKKLTGRTVVDTIEDDANRMEMGSVVNIALNSSASEAHTSTAILSTFRAPRHQFSIKKSLRRPLQQTTIPPGASAVLASREAAEKKMATTGGGLTEWLAQYFAKACGGPVHMPDPTRPRDAVLSWLGAFMGIAGTDMIFNIINGSFEWRGQDDLLVLSGSFGALSTLVYALPAVPLAQPRVIFSAHAMAMGASMVAISVFERGKLVWLQKGLTVASVLLGMSLMGIVHPPAGALCLVFIGAYNHGSTNERMEMLVVSVMIGLVTHVIVAMIVNNLSPRRAYPVFW